MSDGTRGLEPSLGGADRWAFLSQAVSILGALVVVPLLLRLLDSSALGLWYVFATLGLIAQLARNALDPTIARHIAAASAHDALSGATSAAPAGQTAAVLHASEKVFRLTAIALGLFLYGPGFAFVAHVARSNVFPVDEALVGWCLYSGGLLVDTSFGHMNPALQGGGRIVAFYRMTCVLGGLQWLSTLVAVALLPDLRALGAAALLGAILGRTFAYFVFRGAFRATLSKGPGPPVALRPILTDGFRLGLAQVGAFLIVRSNILVASLTLGLKVAASYALTMQAFDLITTIVTTPFYARLPLLYRLRRQGDMDRFEELAGQGLVLAWAGFVAMWWGFVLVGPSLLSLIRSGTDFLPFGVLVALGAVLLLELNHSLSGTLITASGLIPFSEAALLSGIAVPSLAIFLVLWTDLGIWAMLVAQGAVQAAYNNWKWPLEMHRLYGTSYERLFRRGMRLLSGASGEGR